MKKGLTVLLEFKDATIPSVNSIYMPRKGGGRYMAPAAKDFKDRIITQLNSQDESIIEEMKKIPLYHLHIEYVLKQGSGRRDLDNMNKLVQDALFQYLGVNDARVVSLNIEKYAREGGNMEFILIKLTETKIDINKYAGG